MSAAFDPGHAVTPEQATQNRVIALFRNVLDYEYLGDWTEREGNSNVEESLLTASLTKHGYSASLVSAAVYTLKTEANKPGRDLYDSNKAVYSLLRYGAQIKVEAGKNTETVHFIDWDHPERNDFAIAEEVTLKGGLTRRPDIVLYVNGIAIAVLELKNSRVSIGDGIRQNLSNQEPEFNAWFFSTVQFVFAGSDSEGLKYGTVRTPEKFFLKWKEDEADNAFPKLEKYLAKMCEKSRLIELMYDFVLFDAGAKKLPRPHQYFGIKAAQKHVEECKSGIIWHTQGSGKSIVMVLLAKWILERYPASRVVVITDRDELDKQIEGVFNASSVPIRRTRSGSQLVRELGQPNTRLLCSLVHKFGRKDVDNFEDFICELEAQPSLTVGEVFVFVDECHRSQSGRLHRAMKALMPSAVFIGFTGTPLLKADKQTSFEVFGGYIHTYKFAEAVADEVILDLVYDPRVIEQRLGSKEKVDAYFEAKSKGLTPWQRSELKKHWGTMQKVLSAEPRKARIVEDIIFDFTVRPRLASGRGNAILVAASVYDACCYYDLFQDTPLKLKCAIVTSYEPQAGDITRENTGDGTDTYNEFKYETYTELLKSVTATPGMSKTSTYEENAKNRFVHEPANMKLLIVVDKLLTGFDAPPCSFLYIDKAMQDHGLFQAICRTNRLDGEDKSFGYVVDYKDLFRKVEGAMSVYASELDESAPGPSPQVLLENRVTKGRERIDTSIEVLFHLCEGVPAPRGTHEFIHYFCGNTEVRSDLEDTSPLRVALYKAVAELVRSVSDLADDMLAAGYTEAQIAEINSKRDNYLDIREIIRKAPGEFLDLKTYEADMQYLIDTFIEASESKRSTEFEGLTLLDIIEKIGIEKAIEAELGAMKGDKSAIAETITNNVRKKIVEERVANPVYYDSMAELLDQAIAAWKAKTLEYQQYLKYLVELARKVNVGHSEDAPPSLDTKAKRALWETLSRDESQALKVDAALQRGRPDGWRGVHAREMTVKHILFSALIDPNDVERVFSVVKAQPEY